MIIRVVVGGYRWSVILGVRCDMVILEERDWRGGDC